MADSVNDGRNEQSITRLDETQAEQTGVNERVNETTQAEQTGVSERVNETTQAEQTGVNERVNETTQTEQTGVSERVNETTQTEQTGVNERVNVTTQSADLDVDEIDGFISNYLLRPKGTYQPRKHEVEDWGYTVGILPETKDPHECLYQLLRNTAPDVGWRDGLFYMLKETSSEASTRKVLTFLHSMVASGIKAIEGVGYGESIHADDNPAPKCMKCSHWVMLMEGLHFDLTSLQTEHDINNVGVAIAKNTDNVALAGFCHLIKAMLDLSWTHLHMLSRLKDSDGQFLNNTLELLCSGYGTSVSCPDKLDEMESTYPYLMKSLGFLSIGQYDQLQWQMPDPNQEFQCLYLIFNGLFSSVGEMESVL